MSALHIHIVSEKTSEGRPLSIRVYEAEIRSRLEAAGVTFSHGAYEDRTIPPGAALVWAPGLGNRRVPKALFRSQVPSVATVHGLQTLMDGPDFRHLPARRALGHYWWRLRIRHDWRRLAPEIGAVISVSARLKQEIEHKLGVAPERVEVIHNGSSDRFFRSDAEIAAAGPMAGDYVFHISQHSPVKNVPRILAAYESVRDRIGLPLRLVSVGYPTPGQVPEGVEITTSPVPHDEVRRLMWGARVFLFPSLEESFGLPVAEAMASGVPVVTSLGTGAGEVAGSAGLCVDPADTAAIAGALVAAATDAGLRARMIAAGQRRAAQLTWENSASRHLALFRRLAAAGA